MTFFLYKQERLFYQGDGLLHEQFIHLLTDHFTPQHTAFEQLAACLSGVFELLPGFIRTRWVNFREKIYINMIYNYSTTIYESIFAQMYNFLLKYFQIL